MAPPALPRPGFIALIALMMAQVAMSIDSMLPALPQIASELGAAHANDAQYVLTAFFAGMMLGQIVYGPVSDSTGRKPAIYAGVVIYVAGSLICIVATSFPALLAGRLLQGVGAAGPRIVAMAMVRDEYEGRAMARVMSFVMSIFILVPVLAPSVGQVILLFAHWRVIFVGLLAMSLTVLFWLALGQPETLPRERRRRLAIGPIAQGVAQALRNPLTLGYTLASGLVFGAFVGYLGASQQIFVGHYGVGRLFPVYFGVLAVSIGMASLVNARLVMRFGMRLLSKWALRISLALCVAFTVAALALGGEPPLWAFMGFMFVNFFFNGLLFSNFNALAMGPMGHIAGIAAAVIGTLTSAVSLAIGTPIGQSYDGTVVPIVIGFTGLTLAAIGATEWAEGTRLNQPA